MKIESFGNLNSQSVTKVNRVISSSFSLLKGLSNVKNTSFPRLTATNSRHSTTSYPEELDSEAKIDYPDLNIHQWRAEDKNLQDVSFIKYMMGINGRNKDDDSSSQLIINKMKYGVDLIRHDSDNKMSKNDLEINSIGFLERDSSKVVYRVDSRNPSVIVDNKGFGPSLYVDGILPMINDPVLITSASLKGSNKVFHDWGYAKCSYQYAIKSENINQVSWADNFKFLNKIPEEHGEDFRLDYDESHIDSSKLNQENIYLIDCSDENIKKRISIMYQTGLATPFGIRLRDFIEHEKRYSDLNILEINRDFICRLD